MLHARKDYNERIQDSANLIGRDEPVFLLRAQDIHMLPMLDHYLSLLEDEEDRTLTVAVYKHMARVVEWQTHDNTKQPDTPIEEVL